MTEDIYERARCEAVTECDEDRKRFKHIAGHGFLASWCRCQDCHDHFKRVYGWDLP